MFIRGDTGTVSLHQLVPTLCVEMNRQDAPRPVTQAGSGYRCEPTVSYPTGATVWGRRASQGSIPTQSVGTSRNYVAYGDGICSADLYGRQWRANARQAGDEPPRYKIALNFVYIK
ncbi:MAG: hypothetical protein HW390_440 [Candidatus Brocadiaceae bacterium]|nr:hypothetical protein [Candidatus Brocadiaceae bacterium]